GFQTIEFAEYRFDLRWLDAGAGVAYLQREFAADPARSDQHPASGRIFEGVAEHVLHHGEKQVAIRLDPGGTSHARKAALAPRGQFAVLRRHLIQKGAQIQRDRVWRHTTHI